MSSMRAFIHLKERTMKDTVLVSQGIPSDSQVVISAIETPVVGMQVDVDSTPNKPN